MTREEALSLFIFFLNTFLSDNRASTNTHTLNPAVAKQDLRIDLPPRAEIQPEIFKQC